MQINHNDRKALIDFIKETKTTQFNKLNASTFKVSTLFLFLVGAIVWLIDIVPDKQNITIIDFYLIFFLTHTLLSALLVSFNLINGIFRMKHVEKILYENFNSLEKQFTKPGLFAAAFASSLWGLFLVSLLFIMIFNNFIYWYIIVPNFVVFFMMSLIMLRNAIKPLIRNLINDNTESEKRSKKEISNFKKIIKNIILLMYSISSILLPVVNLIFVYREAIIFDHKIISIFSINLVGVILTLLYLARTMSYRIIYTWIEDFYNDIHINNYSEEEIRNRLNNEFSNGRFFETITYINLDDNRRGQ